eukprot:EG_transcript_25913
MAESKQLALMGVALIVIGAILLLSGGSATVSTWVSTTKTSPNLLAKPVSVGQGRQSDSTALYDIFPKDREKITRETEREGFWLSEAEQQGLSPWQDPLAWIALTGIFVPFVILGIALATGYIELPN